MNVRTPEIVAGTGEHVVQFYDHESDLARAVGAYLAQALQAGDVSIVIATPAHRAAFQEELAVVGLAPAKLESDAIVWLDAAETMARFMPDDRIDPDAFREVVGGLVREASRNGRARRRSNRSATGQIRAYGEMVALLWDAGDVLGAIELEKLWNELARELEFSLWCAYHGHSLAVHEHADELHDVCHLHTCVIEEATARFAAGADGPLAARRFASSVLTRRPYEDRVHLADARLLVSELATNAVIHAGTPFTVSIRYTGSSVRISVRDWNPTQPVLRNGGPASLSGRGLHLVAAMAEAWGVDDGPDGKTVWAELPLR
ncbi:MAG TPA: MEDS domain-containing protein [Solirubrobacteraceae bacterium]|nr:MEDS domain-containing protein [Solirubrobacteraceae bacterium]